MRFYDNNLWCGMLTHRGFVSLVVERDRMLTPLSRREHVTRFGRRRGLTLLEVSMAAAMLCVLMLIAVQMFWAVTTKQPAAERHALALEAVQALAEQIGNMRWNELTTPSVGQIQMPASASAHLPGAKLAVDLTEEVEPIAAKRVTVELTWNNPPGRPARPVRLTCWAFVDER
jgi:prepilin-type N-terminal cleavage/methylation domain-containing protein